MMLSGCRSIAVFILICAQFFQASAFATGRGRIRQTRPETPSEKIFENYMQDPAIQEVYQNLQWQLLNTPTDSAFRNFFLTHPHLREVFDLFARNQGVELQEFIDEAESTMFRLRPGTTEQYDTLDAIIVQLARKEGFSEEAIKNRRIYIKDGPANAFTVSGSQNQIIVALQSGILENLTFQELAAVIGHELGHIRSEHTLVGQMNIVVLSLLEVLIDNGLKSPEEMGIALKTSNRTIEKYAQRSKKQNCSMAFIVEKTADGALSTDGIFVRPAQKASLQRTQLLFNQALMGLLSQMSPQDIVSMMSRYLSIAAEAMALNGGHSSSIQFFQSLQANLPQILDNSFPPDKKKFLENAIELILAATRAQETSADRYAGANTENEDIASSFGKLLGLKFDEKNKSIILSLIVEQADGLIAGKTPDELAPYVGSSHPALPFRIANILRISGYPALLFANPFMRLLMLRQKLSGIVVNMEIPQIPSAAEIEENWKDLVQQLKSAGFPEDQINAARAQFDQKIKMSIEKIKLATQNLEQMKKELASLNQDLEKLLSEETTASNRGGRWVNVLEFYLAQREIILQSLDTIDREVAAHTKNGDLSPQQMKRLMAIANQEKHTLGEALKVEDDFMQGLMKKLISDHIQSTNKELDQNIQLKLRLMNTALRSTDLKDVETARKALRDLLGADKRLKRTKLPADLGEQPGMYQAKAGNAVATKETEGQGINKKKSQGSGPFVGFSCLQLLNETSPRFR